FCGACLAPLVVSDYARSAKPTYADPHERQRKPLRLRHGGSDPGYCNANQATKKKAALRAAFVIYHHMLCTAGTVMFSSY
ncbi:MULTISPECIES: hypothetical protein, partial [unclassified Janthinobacterium]|uniref:hypothetical protein n=1 Tax=unclassified Janthinobacterium TaxID=2610881 RepID=UPI001E4C1769